MTNLGFLMERQYAPYAKWFGTAFSRLNCAQALFPLLKQTLSSETWSEREFHLCEAFAYSSQLHNKLALTPPIDSTIGQFHTRPFQVINADAFCSALLAEIKDPSVERIASRTLIGSLDRFCDDTDMLGNLSRRCIRALYDV